MIPRTFLHVGKSFLQLVVHLRTKGKVIHKNNTVKEHITLQTYTRHYVQHANASELLMKFMMKM